MADIIRLLPDSVANQIAAGEVVQRPASAVKELLENALDAGATSIKLIVKEAGKTLIQVIDNGTGMSETDARMCFERHATSKLKKAEDLFALTTMGFRGEAMASIAAIAQVELKTMKRGDSLGTLIEIEGSEVKRQEPVQCAEGTSISIKNLFYNVPARRNFLKANPTEFRFIVEEFNRVAIPNPQVSFSLSHNGQETIKLEKGNLRQRVSAILGNNSNEKLVPVDEVTEIVRIAGFVGKPEFAKKLRGDQYFFVNNRFIKSSYLNHAVQAAFEDFIPEGSNPAYFLLLQVDPSTIDVNIHPTKTEIKFEDDKAIYAIIRSAVRQALGKYHIAPSLDFDQESSFTLPLSYQNKDIVMPAIKVNPGFNPFDEAQPKAPQPSRQSPQPKINLGNWEQLYSADFPDFSKPIHAQQQEEQQVISKEWGDNHEPEQQAKLCHQLHKTYILTTIKSGLVVIHQQRAHERVLFERFLNALEHHQKQSQQVLFPITMPMGAVEHALVSELLPELRDIGFDIEDFGQHTFIINGLPPGIKETEAREILEGAIEHYKANASELKLEKKESLSRAMAKKIAIKPGRKLSVEEMKTLVDELFACASPYISPGGKPTITTMTLDELEQKFN
jgi:DNA mismatch repair protein MutL